MSNRTLCGFKSSFTVTTSKAQRKLRIARNLREARKKQCSVVRLKMRSRSGFLWRLPKPSTLLPAKSRRPYVEAQSEGQSLPHVRGPILSIWTISVPISKTVLTVRDSALLIGNPGLHTLRNCWTMR
jgi:hypothetical protein